MFVPISMDTKIWQRVQEAPCSMYERNNKHYIVSQSQGSEFGEESEENALNAFIVKYGCLLSLPQTNHSLSLCLSASLLTEAIRMFAYY